MPRGCLRVTKTLKILESDGTDIKVLGVKFLANPKSIKVVIDGVNIIENIQGKVIEVVADGVE